MNRYCLFHVSGNCLVARVIRADTWLSKGWGVLGRRSLPAGEGLWLPGVASVHTLGVRFPLDLLFLDADWRTLRVVQVPPGRWLVRMPGAAHTLELGAGTLVPKPFSTGERWRLEREDSPEHSAGPEC